jgi:hypothetical protein
MADQSGCWHLGDLGEDILDPLIAASNAACCGEIVGTAGHGGYRAARH